MRKHRSMILAAVVTLAMVGTGVDIAAAGEAPYVAGLGATCNLDTGQYDVTVGVTNLLDVETAIDDGQYAFITGDSSIESGVTTFVPSPVAAGGTAQATLSGPGDSVYVEVGFFIAELDLSDTVSLELAGDCGGETPTTGSSITTSVPSTDGDELAVVAPRFTG